MESRESFVSEPRERHNLTPAEVYAALVEARERLRECQNDVIRSRAARISAVRRWAEAACDALASGIDIVQLIGRAVPLERAGTTWKGLCPFHSEKTPSFHVNPEKGFFHCFGCGAGGTAVKFVERYAEMINRMSDDAKSTTQAV